MIMIMIIMIIIIIIIKPNESLINLLLYLGIKATF
jgi:hypothetical protein